MLFQISYVAMDGRKHARSTTVLRKLEIIEAETEFKARQLIRKKLKDSGFIHIQISRCELAPQVM
jgi:hypothetical protein